MEFVNESFKEDFNIVLAAVSKDGNALKFADKSLKKNKIIVLSAVSNYCYAIDYADESLKNDSEIKEIYQKRMERLDKESEDSDLPF